MGSVWRIILIEVQKQLAYPITFLLRISLPSIIKILGVALLWRAILQSSPNGIGSAGADFIKLYSVLAPALYIFLKTEPAFVVREIYDGTIQRYFTYPRPFLLIAFLRHVGFLVTRIPEFFIILLAVEFFLGGHIFRFDNLLICLVWLILSVCLIFSMFVAAELVCMIIEEGWSLSHILDRLVLLAGGSVIPLNLMPDMIQNFLWFTPFPLIVYVPVLGILDNNYPVPSALVILAYCFWISFFLLIAWLIYRHGREVFTAYGT